METPTYVALSRQTALLRQMDTVANNLANLVTPGFKHEVEVFTTVPIRSQSFGAPQKLAYVKDFATARDFSPGPMTPTGNDLDVAIQGDGFFTVQTPNGPRYTRLMILLYTLALFAVSLLPFAARMSGLVYLAAAIALSGLFVLYALQLWRDYSDALARATFRYSIWYLAALFTALVVDHYL